MSNWLSVEYTCCSSGLTPESLERLSKERNLALVDRTRDVYDILREKRLLDDYLGCEEYRNWHTLAELNKELTNSVHSDRKALPS